jgi:hypothetical protein
MEYVKLGRTGLDVSRICLGCMSYGAADSGNHAWSLAEEEARPFIKRALEGGINFFDTANRYSLGSSEEILGRAIKDFARRDEIVIATKVYGRMRPGPNGAGLSRKAIMGEIDASLRRLGTDYVDLYQIHRWDYDTPIEETLEALHDIVKAGKARYIGASSRAKTVRAAAPAPANARKGRTVSEVIDDHPKNQSAQRGADPLDRGNGALRQVVAPGAAHDIGDHQRRQGAENAGADAIEQLDTDQPEAVGGEGVKRRPDRQDGEAGQE